MTSPDKVAAYSDEEIEEIRSVTEPWPDFADPSRFLAKIDAHLAPAGQGAT